MKRMGIYKISYEQMGRYLNLPEDHHVIDIIECRNRRTNEIGVKVEGPRLIETPEGFETVWVQLDYLERKENEDSSNRVQGID
jgi:hypothetical protein